MAPTSRHQCLIYEGAPSRQLSALAAATRDKLKQGYRCMCLNSAPMIAGMGSYLAAVGVDVVEALESGRLVLSSEQSHLTNGHFDLDRLLHSLEDSLRQALHDGCAGLWATGDMTWEMGPDRDFSKLLEYEWRLEEFMREHPEMGGICQYHVDTLPAAAVRRALLTHHSLFINQTVSIMNPLAVDRAGFSAGMEEDRTLDAVAERLCQAAAVIEPTEL